MRIRFATSALVLLATAGNLRAAITPAVVEVAVNNAAIADDPTLAGAHAFDLRITLSGADDFASAGFALTTAPGVTFYNSTLPQAGNTRQNAIFGTMPQLEYDTAVESPATSDTAIIVLGRYSPPGPVAESTATMFNIEFSDMVVSVPGTYVIGRFTVLGSPSSGNFYAQGPAQLVSSQSPSTPQLFTLTLPFVPEPGSSMLAMAGVTILSQRRRR